MARGRKSRQKSTHPCPVCSFYDGNDSRVTSTVDKTAELMKQAGKRVLIPPSTTARATVFCMRAGEEPEAKADNKKARDEA